MLSIILYLLITLGAFIFMEFVAWFAHKYIMHSLLWNWHKEHHKPSHEKGGFFERNDHTEFTIQNKPKTI